MIGNFRDPLLRLRPGSHLLGTQYIVVRRLGGGGMGAVFEIEHGRLGKRLIAKMLHPLVGSRTDLLARMNNEARTLARLAHRHIVEVHDLGMTTDGIPFFVMEKLEGKNLRRLLHRRRRFDLDDALTVVGEILEGLGHAHRHGVIHRDMKPENVFVARSGAGLVTKILDFGIAKVLGETGELTAGRFVGTPHYASPEQLRGETVTEKSDLYSVGCVLFELLTGRRPFAGPSPRDFMLQHVYERPPRARTYVRVPNDLDRLIARMLEKDPRRRPVNAMWLAFEIDRIRRRQHSAPRIEIVTTKETLRAALDSTPGPTPRATPTTPKDATREAPVVTPAVTTGDAANDGAGANVVTATLTRSTSTMPLDPRVPPGRPAANDPAPSEVRPLCLSPKPRSTRVRNGLAVLFVLALAAGGILHSRRHIGRATERDAVPLLAPPTVIRSVTVPIAIRTAIADAAAPPPAASLPHEKREPAAPPRAPAPRRPAASPSSTRRTSSTADVANPPPLPKSDEWIRAL